MFFFSLLTGKLEVRLLGCEDLLKPLTNPEQGNCLSPTEDSSPAAQRTDGLSGKWTFSIFEVFALGFVVLLLHCIGPLASQQA